MLWGLRVRQQRVCVQLQRLLPIDTLLRLDSYAFTSQSFASQSFTSQSLDSSPHADDASHSLTFNDHSSYPRNHASYPRTSCAFTVNDHDADDADDDDALDAGVRADGRRRGHGDVLGS